MVVQTSQWDPAERLTSPERIASYLEAAFEDGNPALIAAALGDVARAKGMTALANETGLSRESLYRSLSSDGHPEFATVLKVMRALDLGIRPVPISAE